MSQRLHQATNQNKASTLFYCLQSKIIYYQICTTAIFRGHFNFCFYFVTFLIWPLYHSRTVPLVFHHRTTHLVDTFMRICTLAFRGYGVALDAAHVSAVADIHHLKHLITCRGYRVFFVCLFFFNR